MNKLKEVIKHLLNFIGGTGISALLAILIGGAVRVIVVAFKLGYDFISTWW